MKLENKYIVPYFQYNLMFIRLEENCDRTGNINKPIKWLGTYYEQRTSLNSLTLESLLRGEYKEPKLLLRPLENLTTEELKLFSPNFRMYYQREDFNVDLMIVKDYNLALSLHLDLFGLIEAGLAANKN